MNIPVALFAYARPEHLHRTLSSLRENEVTLIYAFSDGPKNPEKEPLVSEVREILRRVDWADVILQEREKNLGLGKSILTGVTEVLHQQEMCLVFEDDLLCVPGTYKYLSAALQHYENDAKVLSVTAWNHRLVTPIGLGIKPYFDGRAECLVWGTWARAWRGMDLDAETLMIAAEKKGISREKYGTDLPEMAAVELQKNIWAVRWLYHHILQEGLCLRPPWNLVQHIGYDQHATNAMAPGLWVEEPIKPCPPIPPVWPIARENEACPRLWKEAITPRPGKVLGPMLTLARQAGRRILNLIRNRRENSDSIS